MAHRFTGGRSRKNQQENWNETGRIDPTLYRRWHSKEQSMKSLSVAQVKAILKEARGSSTRDWCAFLLTFRHALRSQELRQLKLADVDMTNLTITIARVKGSRSGVQSLDRHKGEPLLDEVLALRTWLRERVEDGSQILFPSQKGGMLTRMQLLRLFKQYALAAGVAPELCHPHILRHSLCSVMAEQHADVYAIQQRAGHKNISNTMIYTHISDTQAGESCRAALMTAFQ
jgi:site-specific recombinase XerD